MDKVLQGIMLNLLQQYISMSIYAAQKQVLTSRNPQPWMVDKAFSGLFHNIPQYHAMSTMQPQQQQGQGIDINALLGQFMQQAQNTTPTNPPTNP
jgi:hypothetical protein